MDTPVIVAARTALGTINHTLLTISAIRNANLDLRGVVMIGEPNIDNRRAIILARHDIAGSDPARHAVLLQVRADLVRDIFVRGRMTDEDNPFHQL